MRSPELFAVFPRLLAIGLVLVLACLAPRDGSAAQDACAGMAEAVGSANGSGDVDRWRGLFERMRGLDGCGEALERHVRERLTAALAERAEARLRRGDAREDVERDLREGLVYRQDWHLFERLGDVASDDLDYAEASIRYMYAVHTIANERATPVAPGTGDALRVLAKFAAVWSAADIHERPLPNIIGGVQSRTWHKRLSWRTALGFDALRDTRTEAPLITVTFRFASAELTRHGSEALVIVKALLDEIGAPTLRLTGRAGTHEGAEDGTDDLAALALERAEAVRAWFRERNYKGAIIIAQTEPIASVPAIDGLDLPERVGEWFTRRVDYSWD